MCRKIGTIRKVVGHSLSADNEGMGKRNNPTKPATGLVYPVQEVAHIFWGR